MKDKLLSILSAIKNDLADTWNRAKMVILSIVAVIVALEFNKIKEAVLAYLGSREVKQANAQDDKLKTKEMTLNTIADNLVKEANDLPTQEKSVGLDWNKKK